MQALTFARIGRLLRPRAATAIAAVATIAICTACAPIDRAQTASPATHTAADTGTPDPAIVAALAPTGTLRASINLGNPVLASLDPASGRPVGVSVDIANELARRLHVPVDLVVSKSAGDSVIKVDNQQADVGFFAIDPKRGDGIRFTDPYVLIEGFYLVRNDSPIRTNAQVDQAGNTVAVGKGSAYDLFLSRELHQATIVRVPTSPAVVQAFVDQHLTVAAGVKQQLERDAAKTGGLRILDQRFMVIRQAMGVPKSRGTLAAQYLTSFVLQLRNSGFVSHSLAAHHIDEAVVPADGE
ncbi:ABC transporter substrate-binding protein [Paraburkholderia jirisanensis]